MKLGRVQLTILALVLAPCTPFAASTDVSIVGPNPELPPPTHALVPVVDIAPAIGWAPGANRAPDGLAVAVLARGPITRAGCMCCPMAMPGRRNERTTAEAPGLKAKLMKFVMKTPAPVCRAPTGSHCCAMPTAMAAQKSRCRHRGSELFGMALSATIFTGQRRCGAALSLHRRCHADHGKGDAGHRPARRTQPPLDQALAASRRPEPCPVGSEQQRRKCRATKKKVELRSGDRPAERQAVSMHGLCKPERHGLGEHDAGV